MERIAALASSVVASIPTVLPFTSPRSCNRPNTQKNTLRCVSKSISRRVREMVEWSGVRSSHPIPKNCRRPSESARSEEHTSELQSLAYLVCRLLLEKKKKRIISYQLRTQSYTKECT